MGADGGVEMSLLRHASVGCGVSTHSVMLALVSLPVDYFAAARRERAKPLAPEDRREAILDAVIPLLRERGRAVSTKELAEAAGVAEGTLFRAFGDKDALIRAAIEKMFDPLPFRASLRAIDPDLPLETKLGEVIAKLRDRFMGVFQVMAALEIKERPPVRPEEGPNWIDALTEVLAPDVDRLTVPIETVAYYLRLLAFSSSLPHLNLAHEFSADELARLITHGVATPETGKD